MQSGRQAGRQAGNQAGRHAIRQAGRPVQQDWSPPGPSRWVHSSKGGTLPANQSLTAGRQTIEMTISITLPRTTERDVLDLLTRWPRTGSFSLITATRGGSPLYGHVSSSSVSLPVFRLGGKREWAPRQLLAAFANSACFLIVHGR